MDKQSHVGAETMKEPLYVCVHVANFAVQALLRLRPGLMAAPVAVLSGDPPLQEVCSANIQAFHLGISQGMTRAELEHFARVVVLRRSEEEERTARAALLEMAGAFTPRIEVRLTSAAAFIMMLDMTGTSLIFGPIQQSIHAIARALTELNFTGHLTASANFHTAVCLAHTVNKEALIAPVGKEAACLSSLPLSALQLSPQHSDKMSLWGLRTLGELAALPEAELIARLGQEGRRLWLLARGEHPHLMVPEEPVFTLEEFVLFDAPVDTIESILFVLGPMLDQLLVRAQNRSFALASVTLKLGLDGGHEHERTIKPALPVLQRDVLIRLLHLDLQAHPPQAGILSVHLHAVPGDSSKVQLGIFAPQLPEPLRLDVTLARIAAIVGEDRVGRARIKDTHCPDGFLMERFLVPAATSKKMETTHAVGMRRYRPPLKLTVKQEGKRIESFLLHGKRYAVHETYGPWRRSGDWWSKAVWSFEEWDVWASTHGNAHENQTIFCLITHDLLSHFWRLEGLYD